MRQSIKNGSLTLSSWKEIAEYLNRGIRTVQRWEHELGLPVHRIGKGRRSPVFSTISELNFWISTSNVARGLKPQRPVLLAGHQGSPIDDAHRLLSNIHQLARMIAENSVRQHKQAEILQARVLKMRRRIG